MLELESRSWVWGALWVALAAACGGEEAGEPLGPLPDPRTYALDGDGPFAVGYRTLEVSYTSPAGPRELLVHLWYPTEQPGGEHPVYSGLFPDEASFVDAPRARPAYDGRFPLLVHSHGHLGFAGNSADIMRHFATHGWLAVAPDHTDNTLSMNIEPRPTRHFFERPLDIRASLDAVQALPASDPLAGLGDVARVAMTGHSFGTYTTWVSGGAAFDLAALEAACEGGELPSGECTSDELAVFAEQDLSEPRVTVVIPMAGGARDELFGAAGYDAVDVPVLLMTGSEDEVGAAALFDRVSDAVDMTWVDIAGGCHQLFGLGGCELLDDGRGFPIVNAYVLAFARRYVLGDEHPDVVAVVEGTELVADEVTFERK